MYLNFDELGHKLLRILLVAFHPPWQVLYYQRVHMEVTELRSLAELCHMFESEPDLKMHDKNCKVFPLKLGAKNCLSSVCFMTI